MNRLFLTLSLPLVFVTSGCMMTSTVVRDGWSVGIYASGAEKEPEYQPPIAYKDTNGDVIFKFDAVRQPLDWMGDPKMAKRKLIRITNVVSRADLRPISDVYRYWSNYYKDVSVPLARTEPDFVPPGEPVPIGERPVVGNRIGFLGRECAYLDGEWIWYVPPRDEGDSPMVALLSKATDKVSAAGVAGRIFLVPPCLAIDAILSPMEIFGYMAGGGGPGNMPSPFLESAPDPNKRASAKSN